MFSIMREARSYDEEDFNNLFFSLEKLQEGEASIDPNESRSYFLRRFQLENKNNLDLTTNVVEKSLFTVYDNLLKSFNKTLANTASDSVPAGGRGRGV